MNYFGTDGIRDNGHKLIKQKIGYHLGKALTRFKTNKKAVFIARDTRKSGETIANQIKKGLIESGIDVYDLGMFPTPVLAYFTIKHGTFGFMVTASHNPYQDNGIKIFNKGKKIDAKYEAMIEEVIDGHVEIKPAKEPGKKKAYKDPYEEYKSLYSELMEPVDFKVCIDLANGATTATAPKIFGELVEDLIILGNDPDGVNINLNCGSTHLELLQNTVLENGCDFGIAFDGDGDRLLAVDDEGEIIDGDFLIYLFAGYLKANKQLDNKLVALSKMCNIGIIKALNEKNIEVVQTNVGDKYITQALDQRDAVLGGENSGHIINKTLLDTGDGVLNAVFLLNVLTYYKTPLSALKTQVTYYPDRLVNIRNVDKSLSDHPEVIELVEKQIKLLRTDGKVLVRPSGTEPLIRVSVSAPTVEQVNEISDLIVNKIKSLDKDAN